MTNQDISGPNGEKLPEHVRVKMELIRCNVVDENGDIISTEAVEQMIQNFKLSSAVMPVLQNFGPHDQVGSVAELTLEGGDQPYVYAHLDLDERARMAIEQGSKASMGGNVTRKTALAVLDPVSTVTEIDLQCVGLSPKKVGYPGQRDTPYMTIGGPQPVTELDEQMIQNFSGRIEPVPHFREYLSLSALQIYDNPVTNTIDEYTDEAGIRKFRHVRYMAAAFYEPKGTGLQPSHVQYFANAFNTAVEKGLIEHGVLAGCKKLNLVTMHPDQEKFLLLVYPCGSDLYESEDQANALLGGEWFFQEGDMPRYAPKEEGIGT